MAAIVENKKGFKVIQISRAELSENLGGFGICDWCNQSVESGYLIAVLNHWYCPKCYNDWVYRAKHYQEDMNIENRNFDRYKTIFEL